MNYKHLSKYHHIYRLSIGGDMKAHIEKFPIAYSNNHYIYIIVPGSNQLERATLLPENCYDNPTVYTNVEKVKEKLLKRFSRTIAGQFSYLYGLSAWFLLDDVEPLKRFADEIGKLHLRKIYLEEQKAELECQKKKHEAMLADINKQLSALEDAEKEE